MKDRKPDPHAPHDGGYRLLFSHPRMVADLLRGFIHEPWVEELDFDSRGDVLSDGRLPPVLPMVLYNGGRAWDAALEMAELVTPGPAGLEGYSPRLRYALVDEGRLPETALEQPENLMAALAALERSESPTRVAQVVARLVRWLDRPQDRKLRRAFVSWMRHVLVPARLGNVVVPEVRELEEFRTMLEERVVQWTKDWKQQGLREGRKLGRQLGREEGREEGRKEGRKEGRREGEASVLLRQLQLKFGSLDEAVAEKVAAAEGPERLRWAERLIGAETLDQVFAD